KLSERPEEKAARRRYRLPTEAEWEYACRGKENATAPFHFGHSLSSSDANFDGSSPYGPGTRSGRDLKRTAEAGSSGKPNDFGLYDRQGNVAEWCADWYGPYDPKQKTDPKGPASGTRPVVRGGSWMDRGIACRAADRNASADELASKTIGFRVVFDPPAKAP